MGNNNAPYVAASDTSKARAQREDASGITARRRLQIIELLEETSVVGATWQELAQITGLHHGQISATLSRLHESGYVFQLKEPRNGCHPYVLDKYRDDFYDYERNDEPVKTRKNARLEALEAVAKAAYDLCYSQAKDSDNKWDNLRIALAKVEIPND